MHASYVNEHFLCWQPVQDYPEIDGCGKLATDDDGRYFYMIITSAHNVALCSTTHASKYKLRELGTRIT